ncbi:TniQ family protein [Xanthomonas campestris]|uniref:TniQ family protein n=1 Tax=Xanthomonas campestris TaxID=339 RepID=UPI002A0933E6|nr:TniQ family protein [Xanthomonas campestris]MCC5058036.1 TniQ family protein [Xanthomonas campestris]
MVRLSGGRSDSRCGFLEDQLGWESWRSSSTSPLIRACPACLKEQGTLYYCLSWRFRIIRTCQNHDCWLLPAQQAGEQALFRGDGNGCLAHALAMDSISLQALSEGEADFMNSKVSAEKWFSKLLPILILNLEGSRYGRHPELKRLFSESERFSRLFGR